MTALTSLLLACAPAAQPAATSAPAPAAAAPAASAAAKPPAGTRSQPPAAGAGGQAHGPASGQITIVFESEPPTIIPKDTASDNGYFVLDNVYDHLVARDYSSGSAKLVPQLADSWSRVDDRTWRFKLHQGVKFTNGESFNADAVVAAIADMTDPQKPAGAERVRHAAVGEEDRRLHRRHHDVGPRPDPAGTDGPLPDSGAELAEERRCHGAGHPGDWQRTVPSGGLPEGPVPAVQGQPNYWGPNKPKIAQVKTDHAERGSGAGRHAEGR